MSKVIYCSECKKDMLCNRTTGEKIYPHRKDLYKIVIWECPKGENSFNILTINHVSDSM